jgi:predicted AlkP superfamily phosphohydrolase/phosphomutase
MTVRTGRNQGYQVVIVGLDGATLDLMRPWAAEGQLPTFNHLLTFGAHGTLQSTMQPASPPAWASFRTGTNPGKHGVFDFSHLDVGRKFMPVASDSIHGLPFWTLAGEAGKQVCLINVPFTYPPFDVNGVMISGFPCPDTTDLSYPPELMADLQARFGEYRVDLRSHIEGMPIVSHDFFINDVHQVVETRGQIALHLLRQAAWDCFTVVFTAPDRVQNVYWQYSDPEDPRPTAEDRQRWGHVILEVYRQLDEILGQILDQMDDSTFLIVMSDHGFGAMYKEVNLNRWLVEQGFLVPVTSLLSGQALARGFRNVLRPLLSRSLRSKVRSRAPERALLPGRVGFPIDWSRTLAYSVGKFGNVFLNVRGREPNGIVEPGMQYEQVRSEVIERLTAWMNPETGKNLVRKAWRREELYSGPHVGHAPDIVIEWEDYRYHSFLPADYRKPLLFEPVPGRYKNLGWTGNHRPEGILLMKGPGIQAGARIEGARMIDVAPTILYVLGLKAEFMDGEPLLQAFSPDFRVDHRTETVTTSDYQTPSIGDVASTYSEEELEEIESQLRSLGYME